jgi:16S rRNA (adenine1518-N6/adenine1519-N6)-dimethyltransferase
VLRAHGLTAQKRFGQNFLIDGGAVARIAALCVEPGLPIVEIGPGTGALTRAIASAGADLTAIEIDRGLAAILRGDPELSGVRLIETDALAFDYDALAQGRDWCAAGNLPYNIATPLILRWIELANVPQRIVVMVQRDVADRFAAVPNGEAYGSLSIAVQFAMTVSRVMTLRPAAFYPVPKVESSVVVLQRRAQPAAAVRDRDRFLKVVRAAFAYRRKTLANSLSLALGIPRERTQEALKTLGHAMEIRAEQLALGDFAALSDALGS